MMKAGHVPSTANASLLRRHQEKRMVEDDVF